DDAEAIEECGLGGIGLGDAAQPDLIVGSCRQHDVVRLNSCEFFEYRAWGVAKPGALLPHRAHVQLILLDPKSGFGLGELDVALPQLFIVPIGDVRAQEIGALRERGPIVERGVVSDMEAEAGRASIRLQRYGEAGSGTLILLQDTADLPGHWRWIEVSL